MMSMRDFQYNDSPFGSDREIAIPHSPRPSNVIESRAETDEETAARKEKERQARRALVKKERAEHSQNCKTKKRDLEEARRDYRVAKLALAGSIFFLPPIVTGWVLAISWGVATNLSGGRGGVIALYIIGLLVFSIIDGIGLCCSVDMTYRSSDRVRRSIHARDDAMESLANYEVELQQNPVD